MSSIRWIDLSLVEVCAVNTLEMKAVCSSQWGASHEECLECDSTKYLVRFGIIENQFYNLQSTVQNALLASKWQYKKKKPLQ